jgi:ABC-type bacteriocin/lantibiotic exporter with double-glycine peptidase domain
MKVEQIKKINVMKNINRYKVVLSVAAALIFFAVISSNAYLNALIVICSFLFCIFCFSYIEKHQNSVEIDFIEKINKILD